MRGLMLATMHSLGIVDPAVLYRLPADVQAMHLAHVRNTIGDRYTGDVQPSASDRPRRKGKTDMMTIFRAIDDHRSQPPTAKALRYARQIINMPNIPAALRADAEATLAAGGVQ